MEKLPPPIEMISPEFAWDNAVSALTVVIASHQHELIERYGFDPLEEGSQKYYLLRADRLMQKHKFSKADMLAEAISSVADAMDEHSVNGFVQLPEVFNELWPTLPDPQRALSTPAQFS